MRKLFAGIIVIALMLPIPAQGFFHRDCNNLKSRTTANQKEYNISWDKYQTAFGRWQRIKDSMMKYEGTEAINRLRATMKIAEKSLLDFKSYSKCIKATKYAGLTRELKEIRNAYKDIEGNGGFALYNNYLPSPIDYLSYLK